MRQRVPLRCWQRWAEELWQAAACRLQGSGCRRRGQARQAARVLQGLGSAPHLLSWIAVLCGATGCGRGRGEAISNVQLGRRTRALPLRCSVRCGRAAAARGGATRARKPTRAGDPSRGPEPRAPPHRSHLPCTCRRHEWPSPAGEHLPMACGERVEARRGTCSCVGHRPCTGPG